MPDSRPHPPTHCVITSFGVLHAPAPEGDAVAVDLRTALRNPHHDPNMRELTGLDEPVSEHVLATPGAEQIITDTVTRVTAILTAYRHTSTRRCDVHVYCQGGRHRSVAVAEAVAARLTDLGFGVEIEHRDITKPVIQPTN